MKKIMIAVAIVCAAVITQAASVSWQVTGAASANKGVTTYLLQASDIASTYESVADFTGRAISSAQITRITTAYKTAVTAVTDDRITKSGTYYYAILTDDDTKVQYVEASNFKGSVYGEQDPNPGTYTATSFTAITASSSYAEIVPEPTSGLLLLIGMAGLALRRRRA